MPVVAQAGSGFRVIPLDVLGWARLIPIQSSSTRSPPFVFARRASDILSDTVKRTVSTL